MAKITSFMYGIIISVGLFAILSLALSQLFVNYDVALTSGYNSTFGSLSNYSGVNAIVEQQKGQTLAEANYSLSLKTLISGQAFDIIGFWFERGFSSLKSINSAFTLFYGIVDASLNSLSSYMGIAIAPLRFIIGACVVVAIVLGVILSTLVKREV